MERVDDRKTKQSLVRKQVLIGRREKHEDEKGLEGDSDDPWPSERGPVSIRR